MSFYLYTCRAAVERSPDKHHALFRYILRGWLCCFALDTSILHKFHFFLISHPTTITSSNSNEACTCNQLYLCVCVFICVRPLITRENYKESDFQCANYAQSPNKICLLKRDGRSTNQHARLCYKSIHSQPNLTISRIPYNTYTSHCCNITLDPFMKRIQSAASFVRRILLSQHIACITAMAVNWLVVNDCASDKRLSAALYN